MFKGYWIVADMDGTLTPTPSKAGGRYPSLSQSSTLIGHCAWDPSKPYVSCLPPLKRFISEGGSLCVVSTAGERMFRQIYRDLSDAVFPAVSRGSHSPGMLLLCGFTGSVLFRSKSLDAVSPVAGSVPLEVGMEEWVDYRESGGPGGSSTVMRSTAAEGCLKEGYLALVRVFEHVWYSTQGDREKASRYFETILSRKYKEPFTSIFDSICDEIKGRSTPPCFRELSKSLNLEKLREHGCFLKETNDAVLDLQRVPNASEVTQLVVMGVPFALFDSVFASRGKGTPETASLKCCPLCEKDRWEALDRLDGLGLVAKSQPNSVCIHRQKIDKSTCVEWMLNHPNDCNGFQLEKALAFGDVPATVDRALATFAPMHFISVSPKTDDGIADTDPIRTNVIHVGGEEEGTALFLNEWLRLYDQKAAKGELNNLFEKKTIQSCAEQVVFH